MKRILPYKLIAKEIRKEYYDRLKKEAPKYYKVLQLRAKKFIPAKVILSDFKKSREYLIRRLIIMPINI